VRVLGINFPLSLTFHYLSHRLSTTSSANGRKTFKITHPFIPQYGNEYEFIDRRLTWGEDRVVYINQKGDVAAVLTSWTDVAEPDIFVLQSAGRSNFRYSDLIELSRLLKYLKNNR
jgi:hypothetical protein